MNAAKAPDPPYDIDVEQALLGCVMLDKINLGKVLDLKPEAFFDPVHQRAWRAVLKIAEDNKNVTYVTVGAMLQGDAGLLEVGGGAYLRSLCRAAPAMPNVRDYAQILADLASKRALIRLGEDLVQTCYVSPLDATPAMIVAEHQKQLERLEQGLTLDDRDGYVPFGQLIETELRKAERYAMGEKVDAILSYVDGFDELTGGMQADDFIVVAGRPGMGKTVSLTKKVLACARQGRPAIFFEFEMSRAQLGHRFISDWLFRTKQDNPLLFSYFRTGRVRGDHLEAAAKAQAELGELPIHVIDRAGLTIEQMTARADRIIQKAGKMGLVAVDYLQLVEAGDRYAGNKVAEVSEISGGLKKMAKRLHCPVVTASQLSRKVEDRPEKDRMPRMADLRETGAIEQDADIIEGLLRRVVYVERRKPEKNDPKRLDWLGEMDKYQNVLEVDVMKNRGGPTGSFECFVHIGAGAIRNVTKADEQAPEQVNMAMEFGIPDRRN
jgi:replicative DNA helicase